MSGSTKKNRIFFIVVLLIGVVCLVLIKLLLVSNSDTLNDKSLIGKWEYLAMKNLDNYYGEELYDGQYLDINKDTASCKIINEYKDIKWKTEGNDLLLLRKKGDPIRLNWEDSVLSYGREDLVIYFTKPNTKSKKAEEIITNLKKEEVLTEIKPNIHDGEAVDYIAKWKIFAIEDIDQISKSTIYKDKLSHIANIEKDGRIILNTDKEIKGNWKFEEELKILEIKFDTDDSVAFILEDVLVLVTKDKNYYLVKDDKASPMRDKVISKLKSRM